MLSNKNAQSIVADRAFPIERSDCGFSGHSIDFSPGIAQGIAQVFLLWIGQTRCSWLHLH